MVGAVVEQQLRVGLSLHVGRHALPVQQHNLNQAPDAPSAGGVAAACDQAALQASFMTRWAAAAPSVSRLLSKINGPDDRNDALQDVLLRAWEAYPTMVQREASALAAGLPSPHRWNAWFTTLARNYLTNQYRRRTKETASFGEHSTRRPRSECHQGVVPTGEATLSQPDFLELDQLSSEQAGETTEPEALVLRAAASHVIAAATLSPEQRQTVQAILDGDTDQLLAARWGTSQSAVVRRRRSALKVLRRALEDAGFTAADSFLFPSLDRPAWER